MSGRDLGSATTVGVLRALMAGMADDVPVEFSVHSPVGCCGDPHPHDVENLFPGIVHVSTWGGRVDVHLLELQP